MSLFRVYGPEECGGDDYPLAWHETVKHLVRDQAGHRCVRCGHPYTKGVGEWSPCDGKCSHAGPIRLAEGHVYAQWRILTVHHLNGIKHDLRWWNLAALCQRCHLQIQGKVQMARVWPHYHTQWFKPYAAGWYAASYLGEDLTREQTMARLDELLALEFAA